MKLRPVDPLGVDRKWHRYRDFKIEVDASEAKLVRSASFSMPVVKGLIKRIAPEAEILATDDPAAPDRLAVPFLPTT